MKIYKTVLLILLSSAAYCANVERLGEKDVVNDNEMTYVYGITDRLMASNTMEIKIFNDVGEVHETLEFKSEPMKMRIVTIHFAKGKTPFITMEGYSTEIPITLRIKGITYLDPMLYGNEIIMQSEINDIAVRTAAIKFKE